MGKHKKRRNKRSQGTKQQSLNPNLVSAQPHSTDEPATSHYLLKKPWFWTAVSFFIALGFPIVVPNADSSAVVYFGWFLWALPVTLFLIGLSQQLRLARWPKALLMLAGAFIFLWVAHRSIAERLRPSFVFIVPGVLLNGDTWDFIANHRGSKSSFNVQALFIDEDRRNYLSGSQTPLAPADVSSFQTLWSLPEVNPMGRGSIFAQQLLWKPFNLADSHFTVEITWRDGGVHEEIQIARVSEKWQYAMRVSDRESKKDLIRCRDKDFPSSEVLPSCFPDLTEPGE